MKTINFKYEYSFSGKKDTIEKVIDCDYQQGSENASPEVQDYILGDSIVLSFFDFMDKIGFEVDETATHMQTVYQQLTSSDDENEEPENNLIPAPDQLDYDSFVEQFNKNEEFRKQLFTMFQMYMNDED